VGVRVVFSATQQLGNVRAVVRLSRPHNLREVGQVSDHAFRVDLPNLGRFDAITYLDLGVPLEYGLYLFWYKGINGEVDHGITCPVATTTHDAAPP
jgi:hypothetical protein